MGGHCAWCFTKNTRTCQDNWEQRRCMNCWQFSRNSSQSFSHSSGISETSQAVLWMDFSIIGDVFTTYFFTHKKKKRNLEILWFVGYYARVLLVQPTGDQSVLHVAHELKWVGHPWTKGFHIFSDLSPWLRSGNKLSGTDSCRGTAREKVHLEG